MSQSEIWSLFRAVCVCTRCFSNTNRDTTTTVAPISLGGRLAALSHLSIQTPILSFHHHHPSSISQSLTSPAFPRQACTIISQCLSRPQSLCLSLITDMRCLIQLRDFSAEPPLECHLTHTNAYTHISHMALSCGTRHLLSQTVMPC